MYCKVRRIENGLYGFKNGIRIKKEGKTWNVYYVTGAIAYTGDTLRECKNFIYSTYGPLAWIK